MRGTRYEHLYVIRHKTNRQLVLTYWASSQKHKALFSTRKRAECALIYFDDRNDYEIEEI